MDEPNNNLINLMINDDKFQFNQGLTLQDILEQLPPQEYLPLGALVNNQIQELSYPIYTDSSVSWININNPIGMRIFKRSLYLVLATAVEDLFPGSTLRIEHSLPNGTYCEIKCKNGNPLTEENVKQLETEMKKIIDADLPITKRVISKNDAISFFTKRGRTEIAKNVINKPGDTVSIYTIRSVYDYFYEPVATSTGKLKPFDLHLFYNGLIIRMPSPNGSDIMPPYHAPKKLSQILYESTRWAELLEVQDVAQLNQIIEDNKLSEFIQINETLQERNLSTIAQDIADNRDIKLVLIAGPSSSGKTTFAQRLYIQLRVNGINPVTISLDDYFVDREHTPKDEYGEYDFETIEALDLPLFNEHLGRLAEGEEVEVPRFDFKTGSRKDKGEKFKLGENQLLIIEGIHGLNERLSASVPHKHKRKIYISALTQLNVDSWTPISSSDTRLIRRITRDFQYRGTSAQETIARWPSVRRGEGLNIFPFQEDADYMFNSALIYEKSVLRNLVQPELEKIPTDAPEYLEAQRLIRLLQFFIPSYSEKVPVNSILREFIGESCFL